MAKTYKGSKELKLYIYANLTSSGSIDWTVGSWETDIWGMLIDTYTLDISDVEVSHAQIVMAEVEKLKNQKERVLAEVQVTVNGIEERIQSLMALEYQGPEISKPEADPHVIEIHNHPEGPLDDDLPF